MMSTETKRQTELDILRLLATLAVIMIHAGLGPSTDSEPVRRVFWGIHVAIVWCVPVFFMISGRFFLDPERNVTTEKILRKYIPHIAIALLFWSAIFTAFYVVSGTYNNLNIFGILEQFIQGPYHLWFLYALLGLYLLTPVLRKIAADEKLLVYLLVLFAVSNITFEYLIYLPKVGGIVENFANRLGIGTVTGYAGYFLLGYFIQRKKDDLSKKAEVAIYLLGVAMLAATIAAECLISPELREADFVKQYMKPNVVLFSGAIYTFFVKRVSKIHFSPRTRRMFGVLTEYGFGVYCIHALLNASLPTPQLAALPLTTSLLRVLCLYLASLFLTWLIRKIPYVGKKIT